MPPPSSIPQQESLPTAAVLCVPLRMRRSLSCWRGGLNNKLDYRGWPPLSGAPLALPCVSRSTEDNTNDPLNGPLISTRDPTSSALSEASQHSSTMRCAPPMHRGPTIGNRARTSGKARRRAVCIAHITSSVPVRRPAGRIRFAFMR